MPTNQMHLIAASLAEIKYEERIEIDKSIYYTSTIKLTIQLSMIGFPPQTMRLLNIIYWLRCFSTPRTSVEAEHRLQ